VPFFCPFFRFSLLLGSYNSLNILSICYAHRMQDWNLRVVCWLGDWHMSVSSVPLGNCWIGAQIMSWSPLSTSFLCHSLIVYQFMLFNQQSYGLVYFHVCFFRKETQSKLLKSVVRSISWIQLSLIFSLAKRPWYPLNRGLCCLQCKVGMLLRKTFFCICWVQL
jgi:hypothetical protein